jgi:streptogramin lyase
LNSVTAPAGARPIGIIAGPDGNLWFGENAANKVGRIAPSGIITEFPVPTLALGRTGSCWGRMGTCGSRKPRRARSAAENLANKIGRKSPDGAVIGEYPIPAPRSGPRAIVALSDGRLFFSAHDIGAIGEVIPLQYIRGTRSIPEQKPSTKPVPSLINDWSDLGFTQGITLRNPDRSGKD